MVGSTVVPYKKITGGYETGELFQGGLAHCRNDAAGHPVRCQEGGRCVHLILAAHQHDRAVKLFGQLVNQLTKMGRRPLLVGVAGAGMDGDTHPRAVRW